MSSNDEENQHRIEEIPSADVNPSRKNQNKRIQKNNSKSKYRNGNNGNEPNEQVSSVSKSETVNSSYSLSKSSPSSSSNNETTESENSKKLKQDITKLITPSTPNNKQSVKPDRYKKFKQTKYRKKIENTEDLYQLEITIKNTSTFKFLKKIKAPRVRISLYDLNNGKILLKNNFKTKLDYVPENNYSLLTDPGRLIDSSSFAFHWPKNAKVIIDEEIDYFVNDKNFIIFFELIDNANGADVWHRIAWSFLRLRTDDLELKPRPIMLQLFKYTKSWKGQKRNLIFKECTKMKKRKSYKAVLNINFYLKQYSERENHAIIKDKELEEKNQEKISEDINWKSITNKLQAKTFQNPQKIIYKHHMDKGSTVCVFSPENDLIAYTESLRNISAINIFDILTMKQLLQMQGHEGIIHSIEWLKNSNTNIKNLVSSSEDQTCIIWNIDQCSYSILYVLYHPTFAYSASFILENFTEFVGIATGSRDGILRIWRKKFNSYKNVMIQKQELNEHKSFIISVKFNNRTNRLYSGEYTGQIIEWKRQNNKTEWTLKRKLIKNCKQLKQFLLLTILNRMYILCEMNLSMIDLKTGLQQDLLNDICPTDFATKISMTPCSNWIFLGFRTKVICWNRKEKLIISTLQSIQGKIEFLDFNLEKNLLLVSTISKNFRAPGGFLYIFGPENYFSIENITENFQESKERSIKMSTNNYFNSILMKLDNLFDMEIEQNSNKLEDKLILKKIDIDGQKKEQQMSDDRTESSTCKNKTYSIEAKNTFTLSKGKNISKANDKYREQHTFTIEYEENNDSNDDTDVSEDFLNE